MQLCGLFQVRQTLALLPAADVENIQCRSTYSGGFGDQGTRWQTSSFV
jgi:hypothetical protein